MSRPLDIGINQIKSLLVKMGQLSKQALELAIDGFLKEEDGYVQLKAWSNTIIMLSEEVEDRAVELMALHQPMATDLRTLKAYIKIAYDIERYGRYALDIGDIKNRLGEWEQIPENGFRFKEMAEVVMKCVTMSIDFIREMDQNCIWEQAKTEAQSDDLYLKNMKMLWESNASPKTIIAYSLTIRYLERIADHSTYISESISYAISGRRVSLR